MSKRVLGVERQLWGDASGRNGVDAVPHSSQVGPQARGHPLILKRTLYERLSAFLPNWRKKVARKQFLIVDAPQFHVMLGTPCEYYFAGSI